MHVILRRAPGAIVVVMGLIMLIWTDKLSEYQFKRLTQLRWIGRKYAQMSKKQKAFWLIKMNKIVGVWFMIIGISTFFSG